MGVMSKEIKNLVVLILITTFFVFLITQAQKIPQIPRDIRNQVPEKDWIELYCYEAKSRGGEAIAKIEALAELLPPILKKVEELGIKVKIPDILSISKDLESKLEAVCQQTTLKATQAKLREFISKANSIRNTLGPNLRNQIESALKAKGEEIRAKLEKELRAEGERMGKEVEAKLRAQAEKEAKQIEARLREELKRQIEEELKAQFGGKENIDKNYLLELGRRIGEERGRKAAEKARKELEAKYKELAQKERERITKLMEKKADEIGGKEKRKLEEIRDEFLNLRTNLESLSQAKMTRWLVFRKKAIQKKKEVLISTIGAQIDKGKELIMAYKEEIDQARAEGKDIPSAEELIFQLEADKQSLIDKLSKSELDEDLIRQAGEELKMKWEKIRFDMEKIRKRSSSEIYNKLKQGFARAGFPISKIKKLNPSTFATRSQLAFEKYQKNTDFCRKIGFDYGIIPDFYRKLLNKKSYTWQEYKEAQKEINNYFKSKKGPYVEAVAYWCKNRFKKNSPQERLGSYLSRQVELEKKAIVLMKKFLEYSENSEVSDLLDYKNKLVEIREKIQRLATENPNLKSVPYRRADISLYYSDLTCHHYSE